MSDERHRLTVHKTTRPEDIADYWQARCSCGWVSKEERDRGGVVTNFQGHFRDAELTAAEARGAAVGRERVRRLAESIEREYDSGREAFREFLRRLEGA